MEARSGFQFVCKVSRRELGPALMGRSGCFARSEVWKLGWHRTQWVIVRGKRSREFIHEWMMVWTNCACASTRFWNRLKAKCLRMCQHAWGQDTGGPGCCTYLEHTSSTDCALSFVFDFRPVICLVFRHRISFQPLVGGLKNQNSWLFG